MIKANLNNNKKSNGFTLVELVVIIVVIGVLSTIGFFSFTNLYIKARDSQRLSKITIVAEALEKYYNQYGEYPSCDEITQDPDTVVTNTLVGIGKDTLSTPSSDSEANSFICSDPVADNFGYIGGGSQFTLKYLSESTNEEISVVSRNKPTGTLPVPAIPIVNVAASDGNATATITPVTCSIGTPQYGIRSRINDGTWSIYSVWSSDLTLSKQITGEGNKYSFQAHARCIDNVLSYSDASISSEVAYTSPVNEPISPILTASTSGATTTWSWTAVSCPVGTTPVYTYHYYTSYGYDTWIETHNTSVSLTTSAEGYTYYLAVNARCYTSMISSDWGIASNIVSYYRPMTKPALTATTASSTAINLSWTNTNATSYTLQRATNSTFTTGLTTIATQAGTTFTSSGLNQGARYYYRVNAIAGATSAWSTAANAITTIDTPSAPTTTASTSGATTTWSWTAVSCPTGTTAKYRYYYFISSGYNSGWIETGATRSVSFTTSDQGYTYSLRSYGGCYTSLATSSWNASPNVSYYRPMTKPALTATTASSTAIKLSWTNTNATSYTLQRATNSTFTTGLTTIATQAGTTFTSSGLNQGARYYYRVNAIAGATSAWSTAANAITTIDTPVARTVNAPTTSGATTKWTWNATSCPAGTSVMYLVNYYITAGSTGAIVYGNGNWVEYNGATSLSYTTSDENYIYNLWLKSRCYTSLTTSSWSTDSNTTNYYRPITYYTMNVLRQNPIDWVWCGDENSNCTYGGIYGGTGKLAFGADTRWKIVNNGPQASVTGYPCNNTAFGGDPAPGTPKKCYFEITPNITGGGTYASGSIITVSATPTFAFKDWECKYSNGTGTVYNTNPNAQIAMDGNKICTARFNSISTVQAPLIPSHTLTTSVAYSGTGSTSGGGAMNEGATTTITASPASGYSWIKWDRVGTSGTCPSVRSGTATMGTTDFNCRANFIYNAGQPGHSFMHTIYTYSTYKNIYFRWSVGAASCPSSVGESTEYQWRVVRNDIPSGWTITTSTQTPNMQWPRDQKIYLEVKARCSTSGTVGIWGPIERSATVAIWGSG